MLIVGVVLLKAQDLRSVAAILLYWTLPQVYGCNGRLVRAGRYGDSQAAQAGRNSQWERGIYRAGAVTWPSLSQWEASMLLIRKVEKSLQNPGNSRRVLHAHFLRPSNRRYFDKYIIGRRRINYQWDMGHQRTNVCRTCGLGLIFRWEEGCQGYCLYPIRTNNLCSDCIHKRALKDITPNKKPAF